MLELYCGGDMGASQRNTIQKIKELFIATGIRTTGSM
jgi:hypothetical protein